jgi:hypothetical protein
MGKKKKSRVPFTSAKKIVYNRCRGCKVKYYGREIDPKTGEVLRIFDCKNTCPYLKRR